MMRERSMSLHNGREGSENGTAEFIIENTFGIMTYLMERCQFLCG
jgi:hypothetical protein